ncbi:MAG: RNA-directed DNA polymerase [Desulfobacteraceae bacterium]|nr:RNA-directed DNA polymerase [Desulfobacteraceae bacterium]
MNNLGHVNKLDKYRTLLTEVLPYETPLWFTNEFFHSFCKNIGIEKSKIPAFLKNYLTNKGKKATQNKARIPLNYRIKKDTTGERELSIMHPNIQLDAVEFYEKYKDIIIYHCNQEETSLRKPVKVAGRFKISQSQDNQEKIGVEEDDSEREYSSSYFVYYKMGFIYKFYESYEFHRLEKKYPFLIKLDVARCFNHIYTHSLAWAIKSKDFVKENLKKPTRASFADDFDKLMQSANYDETNGILIGPEVSRIFAEIIFQKIDKDTISFLQEEGMELKRHYDIRRYVDDYFFFYKDENLKNKILDSINKSLEFYRLYINENKSEYFKRPFISDLTMCKKELLDLINKRFGEYRFTRLFFLDQDSDDNSVNQKTQINNLTIYKSSSISNSFIVDIKMIVEKYNVQYKSITGFLLSCMRRRIDNFIKTIIKLDSEEKPTKDSTKYKTWLLVDVEVIFFVYSMDFRVRPTIIIARIIQKIMSIIQDKENEIESLIIKKIFDGGMTVLKNHEMIKDQSSIEILNLILVLSKLGDDFLIPEDRLIRLFFENENPKQLPSLCYFEWITLMLLSKDNSKYEKLHKLLIKDAKGRFENERWHLGYSEKMIFILDFLSCPYVDKGDKRHIISTLEKNENNLPNIDSKKNQAINFISKYRWFVDWDDKDWLEKRLKKKEFTFPYT